MDTNVDVYAFLNSEYKHILKVSKSHELASIKNSEQVYHKQQWSPFITHVIITRIWNNTVMMWLPIFFLPWNFTKD